MFCVKCGRPYELVDKLCPSCGNPVPSTDGVAERPVGDPVPESPPEPGSPPPQPTPQTGNPSYAVFVSTLLGSLLLFSVLIFCVADALARQRWNSPISIFVATLGGCLLVTVCWREWKRLIAIEPETDPKLRFRRRNVTVTSFVSVLVFFTISAVVGLVIGRNGAEMTQLAAESNRMVTLARRISEARHGAEATVRSQINMYQKVEPDVQEWASALVRLRADLTLYDAKFPDQHQKTAKAIAGVDFGLRRAALLKQQIAIAKAIKLFNVDQQWIAWRTRMQPLIDQEHALHSTK